MLNFSLDFFMHNHFNFLRAFETILEEIQHANIVLIVRWLMNIIIKSNFILINLKDFSDITRVNVEHFTVYQLIDSRFDRAHLISFHAKLIMEIKLKNDKRKREK